MVLVLRVDQLPQIYKHPLTDGRSPTTRLQNSPIQISTRQISSPCLVLAIKFVSVALQHLASSQQKLLHGHEW